MVVKHLVFSSWSYLYYSQRSLHRAKLELSFVASCYLLYAGASLVKGIPFNTDDPEVSGLDIFRKLVPIEAHEASSLYRYENICYIHSTHPYSCFTANFSVSVLEITAFKIIILLYSLLIHNMFHAM